LKKAAVITVHNMADAITYSYFR